MILFSQECFYFTPYLRNWQVLFFDFRGGGWFWRHIHSVADFVEANPAKASKSAWNNGLKIKKVFNAAWRDKVQKEILLLVYSDATFAEKEISGHILRQKLMLLFHSDLWYPYHHVL